MKHIIYLFSITLLASCAFTNEDDNIGEPEGLEHLVASPDFNWTSSSEWAFSVDYSQLDYPLIGKKVLLLDDRGNSVDEFIISSKSENYRFETPANTEYITAFIPSIGLTKNITMDMSKVTLETANGRVTKTQSDFNCDCNDPVLETSGTITIQSGETKCLPGDFNGSVFFSSGGTLNICGNATLSNIYGNASGTINIHEDGEVTIQNWNSNYSEDIISNYGALTFTGSLSINKGKIINEGSLEIKGSTSINSGSFVNNGEMNLNGSVSINSAGNINNGSLILNASSSINSNASLTNNCYLNTKIFNVNGVLNLGGGSFLNTDGTINLNSSGKVSMAGENAMIKTKKIELNGELSASNSSNNIYVEHKFKINSSGTINAGTASLFVCSPDDDYGDFNDQISAGCQKVVPQTSCNPIGLNSNNDTDGDGTADEEDQFPQDPGRSYQVKVPGSGYKVIAFEDLWPYKGDYDFNDLVIKHHVVYTKDAQNKITEGLYTIVIQNIGASKSNGIGLQILQDEAGRYSELNESVITDVTSETWNVKVKGENVITICDDVFTSLGSFYQNNGTGPTHEPDTIQFTVHFNFSTAVDILSDFYIFRTNDPGMEIHMPDVPPTAFANKDLFKTGHDASGSGIWYRTENNLPWAMEIILNDEEDYYAPLEGVSIEKAYPEFIDWVKSNGKSNQSWYKNATADKVFKF